MPNYFYTAKSVDGQTKTGNIIAEDSHKVAQILKEEGLILVKTVLPDENGKNFLKFFLPKAKISAPEKIFMVRNLWIMTATGLSTIKIF
ncbi:MAG TPA: hypothetical protein VJA20_03580, partial [Candidatus Nanoarchaeia archaeon]|nr:hypothetical protein [Candidatus Nanoarchaeia archaeon]